MRKVYESLTADQQYELAVNIREAESKLYDYVFCHEQGSLSCISILEKVVNGDLPVDDYVARGLSKKDDCRSLVRMNLNTIKGILDDNEEVLGRIALNPSDENISEYHQRIGRISTLLMECKFHPSVIETIVSSLNDPYIASLCNGYLRLKRRMIKCNIPLVIHVATSYTSVDGMSVADTLSEGCMGLMRAVDLYRPSTGNRFSTYAIRWIRGHIIRCIIEQSRMISIPNHVVSAISKINAEQHRLEQIMQRKVSKQEALTSCHLDQKDKKAIINAIGEPISLDRTPMGQANGGDPLYLIDAIESREGSSPEDQWEQSNRRNRVKEILDKLDYREKMVIQLRYGIGDGYQYTLQEIARIFLCSRERVRQIESDAMHKLMSGGNLTALRGVL